MNCPACKIIKLLAMERDGIEIDYCPQCHGIWLQHGELEKFMQKAKDSVITSDNGNFGWLDGIFDMYK